MTEETLSTPPHEVRLNLPQYRSLGSYIPILEEDLRPSRLNRQILTHAFSTEVAEDLVHSHLTDARNRGREILHACEQMLEGIKSGAPIILTPAEEDGVSFNPGVGRTRIFKHFELSGILEGMFPTRRPSGGRKEPNRIAQDQIHSTLRDGRPVHLLSPFLRKA